RRRLGQSNARLLAVLGGQFDAAWARQSGLVHYLVDDEQELKLKLSGLLSKIKASAPHALATAKKLMLDPGSPEAEEPDYLGLRFAKATAGREEKEGTSAFIEKRKPEWSK